MLHKRKCVVFVDLTLFCRRGRTTKKQRTIKKSILAPTLDIPLNYPNLGMYSYSYIICMYSLLLNEANYLYSICRNPISNKQDYQQLFAPGVSMSIIRRDDQHTYFVFDHNRPYQRMHKEYLVGVNEQVEFIMPPNAQKNLHVEALIEVRSPIRQCFISSK